MGNDEESRSSRFRDELEEMYQIGAEADEDEEDDGPPKDAKNTDSPQETEESTSMEADLPEFDLESDEIDLSDDELEELEKIQDRLDVLKIAQQEASEAKRDLPYSNTFLEQLKDLVPEILESVVNQYRLDQFIENSSRDSQKVYDIVRENTEDIINESSHALTFDQQNFLVDTVVDEVLGYGPITPLIHRDDINEIMVNGPREVYIEKDGELKLTDIFFISKNQIKRCIDSVLENSPRSVDYSSPAVDAHLPDGSRVHAIIPPLAADGPKLTIRKFNRERLQIEDLIDFGSLTHNLAYFLGASVKAKLNIIVAGGTSTGKTTLLNILSSLIPTDERIITIEDSLELKFHSHQDNVIRLETRKPNVEGIGEVTISDLVKECLRMRPDRIVVGEVRGGEVLDMLQAMNTGHDGSFTTVHANTPRETVFRLVNLAMLSDYDISNSVIRRQIATSVDLFVQLRRYQDGSRKISNICEVTLDEDEDIQIQDLFRFEKQGLEDDEIVGEFKCLRHSENLADRFQQAGVEFPDKVFDPVS